MTQRIIAVENLSKAYRIGSKDEMPDSLVGAVQNLIHSPIKNFRRLRRLNTFGHSGHSEDIFWALQDVSFEVAVGEVVGIIGRNGAGKSTLLKILSRITEPTSGRAVIRGRVSSLLEVGTGFHPELTGRENIYLNGTILGMTKREIDRKFDEIVDFSGVEKFLDTPVKRYSSGMTVRLAFSVAAHLEPEILIIDEVLAVGDAEFQRKCLGKMQDVAHGGRTVLFVSHNLAAVRNLCDRCVLLQDGNVAQVGDSEHVVRFYAVASGSQRSSRWVRTDVRSPSGAKWLCIQEIQLFNSAGNPTSSITTSGGFRVRTAIRSQSHVDATVAISITNDQGMQVCGIYSNDSDGATYSLIPNEELEVECAVSGVNLVPGIYQITIIVQRAGTCEDLDRLDNALTFDVTASDNYGGWRGRLRRGVVHFPVKWNACGDIGVTSESCPERHGNTAVQS